MGVRLKPIIPKITFKAAAMDSAINQAVQATLETGQTYFKQTTRTWNTKVVFFITPVKNFSGAVGTDNNIYEYVARGTRPHLIKPVRAKSLVFGQGTFISRTTPGVLGSKQVGTGLVGGGGVARPIFAKVVHHPGTKARGFEGLVAKRLQVVLERNVTAAILKVIG
jgi:hypothetical protein